MASISRIYSYQRHKFLPRSLTQRCQWHRRNFCTYEYLRKSLPYSKIIQHKIKGSGVVIIRKRVSKNLVKSVPSMFLSQLFANDGSSSPQSSLDSPSLETKTFPAKQKGGKRADKRKPRRADRQRHSAATQGRQRSSPDKNIERISPDKRKQRSSPDKEKKMDDEKKASEWLKYTYIFI